MKKSTCVLFLLLLLNPAVKVLAGGLAPAWTKDMKSQVNWQKVTPLGQLIACTGNGLSGINTNTGEEIWAIAELKNSPEDSYQQIPNSPFISLSSQDDKKGIYVVEPVEGKILFSSKAAGLEQVSDKFFLYQSYKILVIGNTGGGKTTELVMVDMLTGKKIWNKGNEFSFTTAAKDLGNNEVLLTSAFFVTKINASTGDEIWKSGIDPRTAGMSDLLGKLEGFASKQISKDEARAMLITPESRPDIFLISAGKKNESTKVDSKGAKSVSVTYSSVYMAFDLKTGKHIWPAVVELKQQPGVSYPIAEGLIVGAGNGNALQMLSYENGNRLLGKKGGGLSLKGTASGFAPAPDGKLLVVGESGNNSFVTLLDPKTGELVFDKAAKIRGNVTYTEFLPNAVLIGTNEEVNLLNLGSGEWFSERAFAGGSGLIAGDDSKIYTFNTSDGLVYRMDLSGTSFSAVSSTPLKFEGKEKPTALEITAAGILLTSDQNLALVDQSGAIKFNKYFPAPGQSGFKKALLIASAVRAAYATAVLTTYSAAIGVTSQAIQVKDSQTKLAKDITADVSMVLGEASVTGAKYTAAYIQMAAQRFKATTQGQDYMLIMTAPAKKDIQLIQVSKSTGETMNTISIGKDREPIYDVDLVDGKLYYMKDPVKMECYQF